MQSFEGRSERKGPETTLSHPCQHSHRRWIHVELAKLTLHDPTPPLIGKAVAQKSGQLIEAGLPLSEDDSRERDAKRGQIVAAFKPSLVVTEKGGARNDDLSNQAVIRP
jgi:hypothetical protein